MTIKQNRTTRARFSWARILFSGLAFALCALLFAGGAAQAGTKNYDLAGAFVRGEGFFVRLPLVGNENAICKDFKGWARPQAGTQNTTAPFTTGSFFYGPVAPLGCIPGAGGVGNLFSASVPVTTGAPRASFKVPTSFFIQPDPIVPNRVFVPIPAILSMSSRLDFHGPLASGPERSRMWQDTVPTAGEIPPWRHMKEGAWASQSKRAALNFTWCYLNALCTQVSGGGGGIIKYSNTDPNGFGGTMTVVLAPGGAAGRLALPQGAGGVFGPNSMFIIPVQDPNAQIAGDIGGKGYGVTNTGMGAGNFAYPSYMLSAGGFVTALSGTKFPAGSASTNMDHNMPWTTGMFVARAILSTAGGNPNTFTWAATGKDTRTANGEGNIQLVSGAVRLASSAGALTPSIAGMSLYFFPVPEPGALGMLAAGGLGIVGLTLLRRRS